MDIGGVYLLNYKRRYVSKILMMHGLHGLNKWSREVRGTGMAVCRPGLCVIACVTCAV